MRKTSRSKDYLRFHCAAAGSGKVVVHCSSEGNKNKVRTLATYRRSDQTDKSQRSAEELRGTG